SEQPRGASPDWTVEVVGPEAFAASIPVTAAIYGEAMQRPPELVVQRREIMGSHLHRAGFVGVLARDADDAVIGFGYGYHGRPGDWWHDVVTRALAQKDGRKVARDWLDDSFELAELHVHPSRHGEGIGRRVLESVLSRADGATAVLSTHDRDSPAHRLYTSVGFVDLLPGFVFPGSSEVYVVMGKRL
ncbi:MAG TPA: GNAT family N-acetyltransferase, partial [Mycobacteriales bacterium]|nr:GNAT family N-acetyltransferase [Mycobacteriales bacterium]